MYYSIYATPASTVEPDTAVCTPIYSTILDTQYQLDIDS